MLGLRELVGHAHGWGKREGVGRPAGLASLGRAAGYEALSLHLSFSFSFVLCLFALRHLLIKGLISNLNSCLVIFK